MTSEVLASLIPQLSDEGTPNTTATANIDNGHDQFPIGGESNSESMSPASGPKPIPSADDPPSKAGSRLAWNRPNPPAKSTLANGRRRSQSKLIVYASDSGASTKTDGGFVGMRDLQSDILDGLGGVEKKLSELGDQVHAHRQQWETQLDQVLQQVSALQTDVDTISLSLKAVRRKQETNRAKIKEFDDSLQAAKASWHNAEANLKGIVTRAQTSLQSRRSELEKALARIPGEESSIRSDLNKIRLDVDILSRRVRGVESRITEYEIGGESNAKALEEVSMAMAGIHVSSAVSEGPSAVSVRLFTESATDTQSDESESGMAFQEHHVNSDAHSDSVASTTSSPLPVSSDFDSSGEYSSQSGVASSNISSGWIDAFDSDNRNEAAGVQLSGDESDELAHFQLFDPSTTVTLPEPSTMATPSITVAHPDIPTTVAHPGPSTTLAYIESSATAALPRPFAAPTPPKPSAATTPSEPPSPTSASYTLPNVDMERKLQNALVSVLNESSGDGRFETALHVLLSIYEAVCGSNRPYSTQLRTYFVTFLSNVFGKPGSAERRRCAWAVALAILAACLLFVDPLQARRVSERPAYEAFLRRRNLLRWSTPDVVDCILTSYLATYAYYL